MDGRLKREADTAWACFGCGCGGEITVGRCFISVIGTEGRTEESKARRRRVGGEAVAIAALVVSVVMVNSMLGMFVGS
jgi:hypothetical protein